MRGKGRIDGEMEGRLRLGLVGGGRVRGRFGLVRGGGDVVLMAAQKLGYASGPPQDDLGVRHFRVRRFGQRAVVGAQRGNEVGVFLRHDVQGLGQTCVDAFRQPVQRLLPVIAVSLLWRHGLIFRHSGRVRQGSQVFLYAEGQRRQVVAAFQDGNEASLGVFVRHFHHSCRHPAVKAGA